MSTRRISLVLLCALLTGCATAYQPYSLTGGYRDRPVGLNRYYVEFYGNGNTNRDTVVAYWLYRCAQLTQEKGYDYFLFLSKDPPPGFRDDFSDLESAEVVRVRSRAPAPTYIYVPGRTITTWSARGVIELRKGEPSEDELDRAQVAKEVLALLGKSVQEATTSGNNIALPPALSSARDQRPGRGSGEPVKLDELESLLPK